MLDLGFSSPSPLRFSSFFLPFFSSSVVQELPFLLWLFFPLFFARLLRRFYISLFHDVTFGLGIGMDIDRSGLMLLGFLYVFTT